MEDAEFAGSLPMPFQIYVKEWVQREHRQGLLEMKESGGGKKVPPSATLQARATFGYLQKQLSTRSLAAHFICDFTSNNPEPLSLMDPLYKGIKKSCKSTTELVADFTLQSWKPVKVLSLYLDMKSAVCG